MKKGITISLIIATYNWPEALRLCLDSILRQTILPSEIIIADDGSDERTTKLIHEFTQNASFPIFHEWHEDRGFRKTIVLNKAISKASSSYIIQIDGDIIASPNFIEDHAKASDCIECRKCEKVCPQHLNITKYLKQVAEKFEV